MTQFASLAKNRWENALTKLAILVSILMIVGGAVGMVLLQADLQKSQDWRQQASVAAGKVEVSTTAPTFEVGKSAPVTFSINTHGVQTDGVQLTFNMITDAVGDNPIFSLRSGLPLQFAYSEVEKTSDGYLVSVIIIPSTLGQGFSTNGSTPFADLSLTPTKAGTIALNFDIENSISTIHASNPPKDELTHVATANYSIVSTVPVVNCQTDSDCGPSQTCYQPPMPECPAGVACTQVMPAKYCSDTTQGCPRFCPTWDLMPGFCSNGTLISGVVDSCGCTKQPTCQYNSPSPSATATPSPSPLASASPSPSASPSVSPAVSPSPSPSVSPRPSASPTVSPSATATPSPSPLASASPSPSASPSVGGNNVRTCNQSCSSNSDCDVNLRCYSGQCRLVTNVTSTSCSNPPDNGLSFQCDEYCADTRECASGLTCQSNRCRNPENLESKSCASLTADQRNSLAKSCNESCSSNSDCDVNLRCYQGACRLATNPSSFSCSTSTAKTVSSSIYGGSKGDATQNGSAQTTQTTTGTVDISKTTKVGTTTSADSKNSADKNSNAIADEKTALDTVKNYFLANPQIPMIIMGIGLGLILLLILLSILKRLNKRRPPTPPTSGGMGASQSNQVQKSAPVYEQNLQSKINALKSQPHENKPLVEKTEIKIPESKPVFIKPALDVSPAETTAPVGATLPLATAAAPTPQKEFLPPSTMKSMSQEVDNSQPKSMLERLKSRNVTPPTV